MVFYHRVLYKFIALIEVETDGRFIIVYDMKVENLTRTPVLLQYLDCLVEKLGPQAKSSAFIYHTNGHDVGSNIFFALYY